MFNSLSFIPPVMHLKAFGGTFWIVWTGESVLKISVEGHLNPGLFNHEFLNHGVEKFMVEKSGVEKSGVEMSSLYMVNYNPGFFKAWG